ncbi:MAG: hypothetical protein M3Y21_11420, partial [Candidatus Eremiobacteraeota bacterium]|nr:hypothetical protein [Candidatus Eremiobacteraeota bacterium]
GLDDVISAEELWRPTEDDEIAGRFAYKLSGDSFYAARSSMLSLRVQHRFRSGFDIGGAVRAFNVPAVPKARTTAAAVEIGRTLGNSARAAVGYNISGSIDPTLTGTPSRKGLYVSVTTLVDRIFGWGKNP